MNSMREVLKFIGYLGRDHRQGAETLFRKKRGVGELFLEKIGGEHFFPKKISEDLKIQDFTFQKKSIFEDQKVIYVGSSDSSVLIGV